MKNFELVTPDITHGKAVMQYRNESWAEEDAHIPGSSALADYDKYTDWLDKIDLDRSEKTIPEGRVPSDLYIAYDQSRDKVVGMIQIRHELNDYLHKFGGHIGYSVAPSERRKGYATGMLKQALSKSRDLGLTKVLVTCRVDNTASAGVIEKCGGILENEMTEPDGVRFKRYWITL